jgi:2-oxoglutarate dehydrogenase E2 component (dihydrolipoamide succinyltransferase)
MVTGEPIEQLHWSEDTPEAPPSRAIHRQRGQSDTPTRCLVTFDRVTEPDAPAPWRVRLPRRIKDTFLSPVVRRVLRERGLDAAQVPGTGTNGRVTRADVERVSVTWAEPAPPAPAPLPETADATEPSIPIEPRTETIPFSAIRRRTAEHLTRSKAVAAHAFCSTEADFEAVDDVRRAHGEEWRATEGFSLTYLPFIALAVIDALRTYPRVNASVVDDALVVHRSMHLGIAVDLDFQGLIVPVVRDADTLGLSDLARAVAHVAERARAKRLSPDDVVGGTFTITNPGPMGSYLSVPIVNQPQVAILSTDGVTRRPVVVTSADGTDGFGLRALGTLGLSFDARVVSWFTAAAFVAHVRDELRTRDWVAELTA